MVCYKLSHSGLILYQKQMNHLSYTHTEMLYVACSEHQIIPQNKMDILITPELKENTIDDTVNHT